MVSIHLDHRHTSLFVLAYNSSDSHNNFTTLTKNLILSKNSSPQHFYQVCIGIVYLIVFYAFQVYLCGLF